MTRTKHALAALVLAFAAGPALTVPVMAQDATPIETLVIYDTVEFDVYGSGKAWLDGHVTGAGDERIGRVHDLLLDADNSVTALVVGVGGFLGIDEKFVAIPLGDVTVQQDDDKITFATSYTRDQLKAVVE
ncbi:MAG: PRC-barrel domain-containing protein [Paracoccus sp. (in: a-proteobacteria)]|uniref:PRC-barrel domain-containing protein n=1 Tax=Paracoccus sp. TaxID=267 RepID=UPI0026E092B1|nr:PRC-barrel domain-containing protein [Paracoccus sp. (in: a-proteobacteria)]MDO5632646.1 PRC-barrel domain-containing protein [Paracoccus sp. (in: a-proteobacteria)]